MAKTFVFNFNGPVGEHIDHVEKMEVNINMETGECKTELH